MEKKGNKISYEKPKIIYEKKIEVLAVVCDSAYTTGGVCRTSKPACTKLRT